MNLPFISERYTFQTKPKIAQKVAIESTACNRCIFEFSKSWSENSRGGREKLSLLYSRIGGIALGTIGSYLQIVKERRI